MSWTVRVTNPVVGKILCTGPDRPWDPPSLLHNGYRVSFRGQSERGVEFTTHNYPESMLKKEYSCTSLPLGFDGLI
jgi:hypothetical protein